ncbi:RHS repeat-associated core domain-containing protein [Streptomyces sp. NPDC004732]|uniref:RHS repeat domain-containing protein n=1 Tax=Streptomyces sp. NPDC004732 TaxID=3154290 RepID=UPI0033ACA8DA
MTAATLLVGLVSAEALAFSPLALPDLQKTPPVPVSKVGSAPKATASGAAKDDTAGKEWKSIPEAAWPKPGKAAANMAGKSTADVKAGALPVRISKAPAPRGSQNAGTVTGEVGVEVLDRKAAERAGIDGLVLGVDSTGGDAQLSVDYAAFRNAIGGDWASRLTLAELPECALSETGKDEDGYKGKGTGDCTPTPIKAVDNDDDKSQLTARVTLEGGSASETPKDSDRESGKDSGKDSDKKAEPSKKQSASAQPTPQTLKARTLFAVTSKPSGSSGDYKATSLSPSGNWQAGDSSGAFTWTYDLEAPGAAGDLGPELSLAYSSTAVDGRTAATNNQANNVGDGFTLEPGFIERRYKACSADMTGGTNKAKNGDLCWSGDNAVLSLGGSTNELVKDDKTGAWKLKQDDGSKVEHLKDSSLGNGDNDGEYWKVTDTAGVQYFFGRHKLPGYADGKETTGSTWTVPVFGNHSGEPCHKADFASAWCQQAWRWNLDYVVNPHGDAMAYYWAKVQNHYGRNVQLSTGKSTATPYTRGGYLKRIEYGLRSNNLYTGTPAAKVNFSAAERCVKSGSFDCATTKFTAANAKHWPDVPFDQYCAPGTECKNRYSPSFWSRKRIASITSEVRVGSSYQKVDTWAFDHSFPSTGDGSSPALWLKSIKRTGYTGGTATALPPITFIGKQLANRVDATGDGIPPLIRYRVRAINNEMGGTIAATYSAPECTRSSLPSDSGNTKRCYPVYWSSPDSPGDDYKPVKDWFHTYAVTQVREEDKVGGAIAKQTDYTYTGGAAWAKSDDAFTEAKYRTNSDFRGYARVKTSVGTGTDGAKQVSEARYFRGIPGAKVADSEGNEVDDHPSFAGMTRDEATLNDSKIIESSASTPWRSAATATHKRGNGLPDLEAFHVQEARIEAGRTQVGTSWQRNKVERTFDSYGMLTRESDLGDTAKSGDETCTFTNYARNTGENMLEFTSAAKTVAKACGTDPKLPDDLISDTRTYFDNKALGAAPDKGDVTRVDEQNAAGTGFVTTERNKVDQHGRVTETLDAANQKTTTAYTPTTLYAPTKQVATNALGHTETTENDPGRTAPVASVDANGKRTDAILDGLGRTVKVWEPGWPKKDHADSPSRQFAYAVTKTAPNVTETKTLQRNGGYRTDYAIADGLGRERESQAPAATGQGRIIAEKLYDSRGLEWKSYDGYYANGDASGELVTGDDTKTPKATRTTYDGAGRPTVQIREKYGDEVSRTTTQYGGDRVTVIPPKGDTATTTVTDVRDRTTELLQYTNADRTKSQSTKYTYTPSGKQKTVTDPTGAKWTYHYDHRDRATKVEDPDRGPYTTAYDNLDRPTTVTDAAGKALTTGYDALGRKTTLKQGDTTRSTWTYDTLAKGQLTKSVRHEAGQDYTNEITALNDRYQPTGTKVTVPAREGTLAGTYAFTSGYNAQTGLQDWLRQPATPGQISENLTYRYGPQDQLVGAGTTASVLINNRTYDPFGHVLRTEYGRKGQKVWQTNEYDEHTGNVARTTTDRETGPSRIDDIHYTFDLASNITRLNTTSGQDEERSTDTQCFTTDALRRITNAWTATDSCKAQPDANGGTGGEQPKVGGPDAYWHSYTYDAIGNRQTETQHKVEGSVLTANDVTRTYKYGQNGATKRQLTGIETEEADAKTRTKTPAKTTDSYAYDKTGNTTKRTVGGTAQDMTWDDEGHLETATKSGQKTEYVYDADGNRLLAKTPARNTLYLPGGNELTAEANGTKSSTRYYEAGGETVAVKASNQTSILLNDHTGTATAAVLLAAGQAVTRRKMNIFGAPRGDRDVNWPGNRGFVGGTIDNTGFTHLGAREYDPTLGRFISVDPVIDTADPQQMHGYTYGNNNPLVHADPDGKFFFGLMNRVIRAVKYVVKTVRKYIAWTRTPFGRAYSKQSRAERSRSSFSYSAYNKSSSRAYEAQKARARADAAARAAQKRADEQRRKADQAKKASQPWYKKAGGWITDKSKKLAQSFSGDTTGMCLSGSAGIGFGGTASVCFVGTRRPDGKSDFGISLSKGSETPSVGFNGGISFMSSNATDFEQLRGDGWGGTLSGAYGIGGTVSHERAIGATNSRGEPVGTTSFGLIGGIGAEAGVTTSHGTKVGRIGDIFKW